MKSLNVSDNLAAGDQERELKKLLEGMADMDDVEIDQVCLLFPPCTGF